MVVDCLCKKYYAPWANAVLLTASEAKWPWTRFERRLRRLPRGPSTLCCCCWESTNRQNKHTSHILPEWARSMVLRQTHACRSSQVPARPAPAVSDTLASSLGSSNTHSSKEQLVPPRPVLHILTANTQCQQPVLPSSPCKAGCFIPHLTHVGGYGRPLLHALFSPARSSSSIRSNVDPAQPSRAT